MGTVIILAVWYAACAAALTVLMEEAGEMKWHEKALAFALWPLILPFAGAAVAIVKFQADDA